MRRTLFSQLSHFFMCKKNIVIVKVAEREREIMKNYQEKENFEKLILIIKELIGK